MNKELAIIAMSEGHKITHPWFLRDEYLHMVNGVITTEDEYTLPALQDFSDEWAIYREPIKFFI